MSTLTTPVTKDDLPQGDFQEVFIQAEQHCTKEGIEELENWLRTRELRASGLKRMPAGAQFWMAMKDPGYYLHCSTKCEDDFIQTHYCQVQWSPDGQPIILLLRCDKPDNGDSIITAEGKSSAFSLKTLSRIFRGSSNTGKTSENEGGGTGSNQ